jgi:hypothetical protein
VNAADKDQVKQIGRHQKRRREQVASDWKSVLSMPAGRRLFAWILGELQPRVQLWNPNAALLGFNAARHDVGTWLKDQIDLADADALLAMFTEQRLLEQQETSEREALRIRKTKETPTEE